MRTIKELRKICQKSEAAPSWRTQSIEGKFNRIFSIYLTRIFVYFSVSPNQITTLGVLFYLFGACLFIFNDIKLQTAGLFALFISFVLDACDGEVARFRAGEGKKNGVAGGAYVEPVSHDVMYAFFFLPIGIGAALAVDNLLPIIAAFFATSFKLIFRLLECRRALLGYCDLSASGNVSNLVKQETPKTLIYFIYRNVFTGTGMFFALIVAVALKHIDWFLYFYAISFFSLWCYKLMRQWNDIKNK